MPPDTRHTKQRQAVLRTVKLSVQPMPAEMVHQQVQRVFPTISAATVYRNLDFFTKRGEIYRVESDDGIQRYIGHMFHEATFRCQRCGRVRTLNSDSLPRYVDGKIFGDQTVFISKLMARGLCASCTKIVQRSTPSR